MKIIQFIRNLTIYCSKFRQNERLSWNILQTAAAITTAESACPVIFALKALFYRHIQKCYLYRLSHSYHRYSTGRENMETNKRRKANQSSCTALVVPMINKEQEITYLSNFTAELNF